MGGLFEAPKPKITVQPAAPPAPAPEVVASEARIENRASASRGLLGIMPDFITPRRSLLGD